MLTETLLIYILYIYHTRILRTSLVIPMSIIYIVIKVIAFIYFKLFLNISSMSIGERTQLDFL